MKRNNYLSEIGKVFFNELTIITSIFVLLFSCAPLHTKKTENIKMEEELVSEMIEEKIKKNMPNVLCDQTAYLSCFDIPKEQCIKELSQHNIECFNKAKKQVSGSLSNKNNAEKFGGLIVMCMMLDHFVIHAENAENIGLCFESASFDDSIFVRSLFK